jgi:hypothetical protein
MTDGLFEEEVKRMHANFPDVPHHVELFDALLAKIILQPQQYQVVLCLNEYGDFLSDMACGLVGSLGTGCSGSFSFRQNGEVGIALFDPAGGTAPDIAGQDVQSNRGPAAFGMLLDHGPLRPRSRGPLRCSPRSPTASARATSAASSVRARSPTWWSSGSRPSFAIPASAAGRG